MKNRMKMLLLVSHLVVLGGGVGLGIYILPLLTAEDNATQSAVEEIKKDAKFSGVFTPAQKGSDAVHWAEGKVYVSDHEIAFEGKVAPGPDYKIYLTTSQANDKASFLKIKDDSLFVGDLKNFGNFRKRLPPGVNPEDYTTVQIWCERFSQFIGSAQYR
jgi:hypothetical protein